MLEGEDVSAVDQVVGTEGVTAEMGENQGVPLAEAFRRIEIMF